MEQIISRKRFLLVVVVVISSTYIIFNFSKRFEKRFRFAQDLVQNPSRVIIQKQATSGIIQDDNHTNGKSMGNQIITVNFENMTATQIGEFQQTQVDKLCKRLKDSKPAVPVHDKQMLLSDRDKVAFCYVPKSGCTTLKSLLLLSLGAPVSRSILLDKKQDGKLDAIFGKELYYRSFLSKNEQQESAIIKNYYKFLMYRNPAERLVSGYLDKIAHSPMITLTKYRDWNFDKLLIYKLVHPKEFQEWKQNGAKVPIKITFSDMVDAMFATGGMKHNSHFRTTFELCSPCEIRYSYYGNFKFFDREVGVFMDRIHGSRSNVRTAYSKSSSSVTPDYYSQINDQQKIKLINVLARDFLFYYTVFPTEQDSHKAIMGIDYDIPIQEVLGSRGIE